MNTEFAEPFGGVELEDTLHILVKSKRACARLKESLGPKLGTQAIQQLEANTLEEELLDQVCDFFVDEILNESQSVWTGLHFDPNDEDDQDRQFPICIREYEGIFFVRSFEEDPFGYFLKLSDAEILIAFNWENVRPD